MLKAMLEIHTFVTYNTKISAASNTLDPTHTVPTPHNQILKETVTYSMETG